MPKFPLVLFAGLSLWMAATSRGFYDTPRDAEGMKTVTFQEDIAPILKEHCMPCHFEGGKVFTMFPFNRYDTVRKLGKRLNTRLKGKNAERVNRWMSAGFPEGRKEKVLLPR